MVKFLLIIACLCFCICLTISNIFNLRFLKSFPKTVLYLFSFLIFFTALIFFRFANDKEAGGKYSPATFDGNKIKPGEVNNGK